MKHNRKNQAWALGVVYFVGAGACTDAAIVGFEEMEEVFCVPGATSTTFPDLPFRAGPPATTTGTVPHQQINPAIVPELIDDMSARIFAHDDVESRPSSIVSGATAIWLRDEVTLVRPECVVLERELGHIHQDGSVHVTLPHNRIPGAVAARWIERHPWADTRAGFETYVMIFSPRDSGEVDVIVELISQGISFVVGS